MAIITAEEVLTTETTAAPSDPVGMTMTTDLDYATMTIMTSTIMTVLTTTIITLEGADGEAGATGETILGPGEIEITIGFMTVTVTMMTITTTIMIIP